MSNKERVLNRTERLFAMILLLQNKPNMTSKDLAEHFDVSRRTIFRDLRALSESGVPLTYAEGGGYEILEGYQLPPLMLSAREAATLLVGTDFMKLQSDASLRKDADHVSMKIRTVLPAEVVDYIDRLRARTVLDPYWYRTVDEEDGKGGFWYELSEAVARQRSILMEYFVRSRNDLTRRTVDPLGLVYYSDHWNLIGFDHLRKDIRNFRLDHIRSLRLLNERFEPPANFNLAEHLQDRASDRENLRIRIWFSKQVFSWARQGIPAIVEEEIDRNEGKEVVFYFGNMEYLSRWLLRFGTEAVVEEPEVLKERIREEVSGILSQYDPVAVDR